MRNFVHGMKNVKFLDSPEQFHNPCSKRTSNSSAYLGLARSAYTGQRRSRTWQSHRAAPQASPLVYTAREKDPRQGLRCPRCGPFRAPCPGSPILSGAQTLPFPSSPGGITAADLVKPRAKRPSAASTGGRLPTVLMRPPPPPAQLSVKTEGGGGHEATETGLAYAPVSQAHGHNHIVQCFACCTAA